MGNRTRRPLGLVIVSFGLILAQSLWARAEDTHSRAPDVLDLSNQQVTAEALVAGLRPPGQTRASRRVPAGTILDCSAYREEASSETQQNRAAFAVVAIAVHFASSSSALTSDTKEDLEEVGLALAAPGLGVYCFELAGFSDDVELSRKRSMAVVDYLVKQFNLDPNRLIASGHDQTRPGSGGADGSAPQRNPNFEIINLGRGDMVR